MDISSLLGVLLACALLAMSIVFTEGASLTAFIDLPSMLLVFGGALAASMICLPLSTILRAPLIARKIFLHRGVNVAATIAQLVLLSEAARRQGLLSLEKRLETVDDKFIVLGLQMAIDGTRPEVLEDILRTEMNAVAARHREGKSVFDQLGRFSPAFGMIGTLIGLILMLGNMTDPASIGSGMAVALVTTLYGVLAANLIFLPFSQKLATISKQEQLAMEITLRGVLAIQSGENPRIIQHKLSTFLPAHDRVELRKAA